MPQLDFYLGEQDKVELMNFVFSEGGYIIPAINYDQPNYTTIKSIDDYRPFVNRSILFFICHDSYFKTPLFWETFDKEGKKLFYIPQRIGGPSIDFYSPGSIDNSFNVIGQGNISYYPSFFDTQKNENSTAPLTQKIFYKKLLGQIKNGFAIKLAKRTYWVGDKTIESLRNGVRLMNVSDNNLTEFLEFIGD